VSDKRFVDRKNVDQPNERRGEPRITTNTPARLCLLGDPGGPAGESRILDFSGRALLLSAPFPAPCGSPVRIEGGDMLLLGEVCRVEPAEQGWRIAVEIRHSLRGLSELERLNRSLLGEDAGRRAPHTVASD